MTGRILSVAVVLLAGYILTGSAVHAGGSVRSRPVRGALAVVVVLMVLWTLAGAVLAGTGWLGVEAGR